MSALETKFPGQLGLYIGSPIVMARWYGTNSSLGNTIDISDNLGSPTSAGAWIQYGLRGAVVDTNFTAGISKQILSVVGPALLTHVVGPAVTTLNDTLTFTIVVDGVTFSSTTPGLSASDRSIIGNVHRNSVFTSDNVMMPIQNAAESGGWRHSATNVNCYVVPAELHALLGTPQLYAKNTLTVSITASANISTTTSNERQCAVCYRAL